MSEEIIRRHNSVVGEDDLVIHDGDFTWRGSKETKAVVDRLNGKHMIVLGNHDKGILSALNRGFDFACHEFTWYIFDRPIHVKHHPYRPPWWRRVYMFFRGWHNKDMHKRPPNRGNWLIHGHCVPIEYEVLTVDRGFLPLCDVKIGDPVFAYDKGSIVKTSVLDVMRTKYTGDMVKFELPNFTQQVTINHYLKLRDNTYRSVEWCLNNGITSRDLPLDAAPVDSFDTSRNYDPDLLRLIVAVCADASFERNSSPVRFHLKKDRKIKRLTDLFIKLKQPIQWSDISKTGSRKSKGIDPDFGNYIKSLVNGQRILPDWFREDLTVADMKVVIDELEHWDGSIIGDRESRQYSSKNIRDVDMVQDILARLGIMSNRILRDSSHIVTYNLKTHIDSRAYRLLKDNVSVSTAIDVDVGCITTEYDSFILRTPEGRVQITGNTHSKHKTDFRYGAKMINVGVDAWNFYPVSLKQIESIIKKKDGENEKTVSIFSNLWSKFSAFYLRLIRKTRRQRFDRDSNADPTKAKRRNGSKHHR